MYAQPVALLETYLGVPAGLPEQTVCLLNPWIMASAIWWALIAGRPTEIFATIRC